jgi:hypothetical protein
VPSSSSPRNIGRAGTYRDMGICPYNVLADTLTLLQPRGADYAQQLGLFRPCLESFRRACRIIIYCCCHFSLRFSPFRSTYNTHVGKSSVSYSIQHSTDAVHCSGESAKEISFLSFNGFGEHMEWASISFRSIRHFRTLHSATL